MSETRKDEVREALWRVIRAAPDDLQDALSLALSPDVPLTSRQIADALLSLHAPEAGEACQHDFAASTETPVLGLLPVARCTKCGAGSIDPATRPEPEPSGEVGERRRDTFQRERDEMLDAWDEEVGNYGFPRSVDIVPHRRDLFADRLIAFTSAAVRATPPAAETGERDFAQAERVAHVLAMGAEGLPPQDYRRIGVAYLALRAEVAALREDKARLEDALEEIRDSDDPRWYDHTTKALHPARASQQEGRSDDPRWYDHTPKALHPARASQQEGRDA